MPTRDQSARHVTGRLEETNTIKTQVLISSSQNPINQTSHYSGDFQIDFGDIDFSDDEDRDPHMEKKKKADTRDKTSKGKRTKGDH